MQDGDEAAFAQLAARHSSRIWQLVVFYSRQTRDAEEIFQDIWVAVWENIGGLREVSSFGAWLRKIALDDLQKVLHCQVACQRRNPSERGETR